MLKQVCSFMLVGALVGCTATGELATNSEELDAGRTIGLAIGVAAAAYAIDSSGGGSSCPYAPALRDYQPGDNTWVCRRTDNGQYTYDCNCDGQSYVDNWQ